MPFDFKELKELFDTWQIGMQEKGGMECIIL